MTECGTFNVAAFYNDFSNQQVLGGFQSSTNAAPPTEAIINAGSSRIYGFEVESTLVPYKGVPLNLAYTYLNSKLEKVQAVAPLPGSPYDVIDATAVAGYPLTLTPKNKVSFTATYQLPLDESYGKLSVSTTYTYQSKQLTSSLGPYEDVPAYGLLNFNLDWESVFQSPFDAEFFMTNVTDGYYSTYQTDLISALGFASRLLGEPRMFGGRLRYHFGGPNS